MQISTPTRLVVAICLSTCVPVHAQSRTASHQKPSAIVPAPPPPSIPAPPPAPLTPAQSPANRAVVNYTDNLLTISASNSSLNQILREVSRLTGIRIYGGVTDERVFGNYGPDAPSQVLPRLLDGTGSNMLLVQSTGTTPPELILTPRLGGPTPPNPNAAAFDENSDSSEEAPANPVARPIPNQIPAQYAPREIPPAAGSLPEQDRPASPANQSPAQDQQQSPNSVKTPQQIYNELQRLRQQQQQEKPQ